MGQFGSKQTADILEMDDALMRYGYVPAVFVLREEGTSVQWLHPREEFYIIKNPHELSSGDFKQKMNRAIAMEKQILQNRGRNDLEVSMEPQFRNGKDTTYIGFKSIYDSFV